jgi:DNA-binding CsgD family transcriptional regulator
MFRPRHPFRLIGFLVTGLGLVLLGLSIFLEETINVALPLVFLLLGGAFYILVFAFEPKWSWSPVLYIPGSVLLALGVILLLNVITNDWQAWAYAWLLILAGLGFGLVLANRRLGWRPEVTLVGWGSIVLGLTFFAVFGVIAGGLFIQIMAPVMLILGGFLLYRLRPEAVFPERILTRLGLARPAPESLPLSERPPAGRPLPNLPHSAKPALVEPLSARELEVLRLVDMGLSNPEIANRLSVASSTVKTHINNIYGKLGVESRLQAVKRARELGLLGP